MQFQIVVTDEKNNTKLNVAEHKAGQQAFKHAVQTGEKITLTVDGVTLNGAEPVGQQKVNLVKVGHNLVVEALDGSEKLIELTNFYSEQNVTLHGDQWVFADGIQLQQLADGIVYNAEVSALPAIAIADLGMGLTGVPPELVVAASAAAIAINHKTSGPLPAAGPEVVVTRGPTFSSDNTTPELLDTSVTTSTVMVDVTANSDLGVSYTLAAGVHDNNLFDIDNSGHITFKAAPSVGSALAFNDYTLTVTATDGDGNATDHNVAFKVRNDMIDLGVGNGTLIAPIQVEGYWYYFWDRSGNGIADARDYLIDGLIRSHDVLDAIFNHDINGVTNTTVRNFDLNYGTTNEYRYGSINGVSLALPTLGSTNSGTAIGTNYDANKSLGQQVNDPRVNGNLTYDGLQAIADGLTANTSGSMGSIMGSSIPSGWYLSAIYWSATTSSNGSHFGYSFNNGQTNNNTDNITPRFAALQVL